jgi:photosystem I P700 chlorophyll a apoprotein A1
MLSFLGGVNPQTCSLWLTDIAHHHLAIAVVFIVAGHLYQTQFAIGSRMSDLLRSHNLLFINSWHSHLSINLALMGSLSILFSHHVYAMPPYPYLAYDHATTLSLFTHHMWIGGFFIVGAAAHAALFMVYDYQLHYKSILDRVLATNTLLLSI